jgi:hypothetical protein
VFAERFADGPLLTKLYEVLHIFTNQYSTFRVLHRPMQ